MELLSFMVLVESAGMLTGACYCPVMFKVQNILSGPKLRSSKHFDSFMLPKNLATLACTIENLPVTMTSSNVFRTIVT